MPGKVLRTDNVTFKNEMQNFTTLIVDMVKQEQLFVSQGGPIILAQIENEYKNVQTYYGETGKKYLQWCASMANSFDIGIPWIMCQQADAAVPMINTCNGWYCDNFTPKMWTEKWTGWFKDWGEHDPHRRAVDVVFVVARFFQTGGVFQNYYMYHGGTNFGRTAGGLYISTSYDYGAPLDEYGHLNQPIWGHLKPLHAVIPSRERVLTHGDNVTTDMGNGVAATVSTEEGSFVAFLCNVNMTTDATITFHGNQYLVPAWSVSILPDCSAEVYNTAKVSTPTSVKVKQPHMATDQPEQLRWLWRHERLAEVLKGWAGHDSFTASRLIDQIIVTGDASAYLWYMNPVQSDKSNPFFNNVVTLRVTSSGHVLHAFFNGKIVGSQYGLAYGKYDFVLKAPNVSAGNGMLGGELGRIPARARKEKRLKGSFANVAATPTEVSPAISAKKSKREAKAALEKQVTAKKHKREVEAAIQVQKGSKKGNPVFEVVPKMKQETNILEDSSSESEEEEVVDKAVVLSKKPSSVVSKNGSVGNLKNTKPASSSESKSDFGDDEVLHLRLVRQQLRLRGVLLFLVQQLEGVSAAESTASQGAGHDVVAALLAMGRKCNFANGGGGRREGLFHTSLGLREGSVAVGRDVATFGTLSYKKKKTFSGWMLQFFGIQRATIAITDATWAQVETLAYRPFFRA
ncbi:beta-galactosidase 15-like [Aristolochia californica]|uniref:beta-galactosidase 15-like n=1 Tax=Aristolochia californica TaxID=171875 RepID=UPI0035D57723